MKLCTYYIKSLRSQDILCKAEQTCKNTHCQKELFFIYLDLGFINHALIVIIKVPVLCLYDKLIAKTFE